MRKIATLAAVIVFACVGSTAFACEDSSPVCVISKSDGSSSQFYSNRLIREAQSWLGASASRMGVPDRLWCMDGLNVWLRRTGHKTVNSRRAIDALKVGRRVEKLPIGGIAITKRRGGYHVSVPMQDNGTTFTAISANHNRVVGIGEYSKRSVVAYVLPD